MPDRPDYVAEQTIYKGVGFTGLEELAVRLGSPMTFDRRGEILWLDTFEHYLNNWMPFLGLDVGTTICSDDTCSIGSFSLKVTTGSVNGGLTGVYHFEPYYIASNFGFEVRFSLDSGFIKASFIMNIYSGTEYFGAELTYNKQTNMWQYYDGDAADYVDLLEEEYPTSEKLFLPVKFVVDIITKKYIRVILPSQEIDMSGKALDYALSSEAKRIEANLIASSIGTPGRVCYFDNFILTQNEPS